MSLSRIQLANVFATIVDAAVKGERAPQNDVLPTGATSQLARAGYIKVEVYAHNWRVIEIRSGEHKGKRTQATPHKGEGKPYKVVEAGSAEHAPQQPSLAKFSWDQK